MRARAAPQSSAPSSAGSPSSTPRPPTVTAARKRCSARPSSRSASGSRSPPRSARSMTPANPSRPHSGAWRATTSISCSCMRPWSAGSGSSSSCTSCRRKERRWRSDCATRPTSKSPALWRSRRSSRTRGRTTCSIATSSSERCPCAANGDWASSPIVRSRRGSSPVSTRHRPSSPRRTTAVGSTGSRAPSSSGGGG